MRDAGVVVAGGRSARFGDREKALVRVGGEPMLRRVVERLGAVVGRVVVNCRADQRTPFADALSGVGPEVTFAVDGRPDRGPLAGIRTGLRAVDGSGVRYVPVVACDLPFLNPAAVAALRARADRAEAEAAVPVDDGGRAEPLHAVYAPDPAERAAGRLLEEGTRRAGALVDRLDDAPTVPASALPGAARTLGSVDDPEALATARASVGSESAGP